MSAIHSLLQRITTSISARVGTSSGTYSLSNYQYNYAIGGVPLLSAATDGPGYGISSRPDVEQAIEQRKDQFDNYKDPGEYSLNQWWLRSQTSFIGGAGVVYQDPDTQGQALNVRFHQSIGIDPFSDADNIQLLRETNTSATWTPFVSGSTAWLAPAPHLTDNFVWITQGTNIKLMNIGTSDVGTYGNGTFAAGSTAISIDSFITESGTRYSVTFVSDGGGNPSFIYRTNESLGAMAPISMYNAGVLLAPSAVIRKAHGFPFLGMGPRLYQLDPASTGSAALPTPAATIPLDQNIVSITDGPDAVYVAANDDTSGYIYKSTFNSSTGLVNGLSLIAVLPNGEMINSIASYVATYMVITTITGIRVGSFTGSGIQYGPPIVTVPATSLNSGFGEVAFFGTNAYVIVGDTSQHGGPAGVMCINLASIVNDNNTGAQTNAYCTWIYNPAQSPTDGAYSIMTDQSGRILFTSGTSLQTALNVEHATRKIASGFLDTGRCRYNTLEPKLFKFMSIKTPTPLLGEVTVAVLDEGGGVTNYSTYGPTLTPGVNDIATPVPAGPQNWLALRFTLRRGATDLTVGGELDSWQLKALPGTLKQRSIVKNFLLFNVEKDKTGQNIVNPALDRLDQIRAFCQRGDTVVFQDLVNDISTQVVIDNYTFTMLAPPGPNAENYGGYLALNMRTVADTFPPMPPTVGAVDE